MESAEGPDRGAGSRQSEAFEQSPRADDVTFVWARKGKRPTVLKATDHEILDMEDIPLGRVPIKTEKNKHPADDKTI